MRWLAVVGVIVSSICSAATDSPVTFNKDVLPVLQRHCQTCHRPGDIGPMPLLTYSQTRPWAKAIREAVLVRKMPPWHADPAFGSFRNDRSLSASEIRTLVSWTDQGTREGSPADAPPALKFEEGWRIGKPDVVIEMPVEFHVPATGTIEYQGIIVPSGFTEDKWVQAVEVQPGNRSVVHHAVVYAREPGGYYAKDAPVGEVFDLFKHYKPLPGGSGATMFSSDAEPEHLEVFAPGADPITLPPGQARLIRAGSDIVFEMHYTPNGKPATDRSRIGLIFAKQPPAERVKTMRIQNGKAIDIAPGDPDYRIQSQVVVNKQLKLVSIMPHMHLRGKSLEARAIYPDGKSEILLNVPRYDFHWQMSYYFQEPRVLPAGTVIVCTVGWDNSANNVNNPDPAARVRGGFQSWDEMMAEFFEFAFDPQDPAKQFLRDAPAESARHPTQAGR